MLALLIALMAADPLVKAKGALIGKDVTNAMEAMNLSAFKEALLLLCCIVAVTFSLIVYKNYIQKMLNINWCLWLTRSFLGKYFADRAYYHINSDTGIDNPDQRISEGIKDYTGTSIGHIAAIIQSLFSIGTFSLMLWRLSPKLLFAAMLYAGIGSIFTMFLSRRLVSLNFKVQQRSADFRHNMVHVRDNTESIALFQGEVREKQQLIHRLVDYIGSRLMLIGWERNLSCFNQTLSLLPMILPGIILAPVYFAGTITLGDLTAGTTYFMIMMSAIGEIISKLSTLNALVASFTRVETFAIAVETANTPRGDVIRSHESPRLALDGVTLHTPDYRKILVRGVSAELSPGKGVLIAGASGVGKSSLLRAIAGLWNAGEGEISRPPLREMFFLPQKPYMIHGTLREQLHYPNSGMEATDEELKMLMEKVNLLDLYERFDGLDVVKEWGTMLSLGEQQRLAFARLFLSRPRYAILDEATSALDIANESALYAHLQESGMTFVSVGHRPSLVAYHDNVLELQGKGDWRLVPSADFQMSDSCLK